ncbi:hypothetical protein [Priestia megaterium]|uniref:Uncharacterized protein n=1 Tax=Priestia megaterium TaxID=1404 RepID=A0A6M6DJ97_PRIMG|nr:hypothetical protein [Priestia megaterium]QJX74711.1 hypothetical protein FDZ14_00400 [Priestia megaterium]
MYYNDMQFHDCGCEKPKHKMSYGQYPVGGISSTGFAPQGQDQFGFGDISSGSSTPQGQH